MWNSDRIDPMRCHQCEIMLDLRGVLEFTFIDVGLKSPIADAFDVEFLSRDVNEFPNNTWSGYRSLISANDCR